MIALYWAVSSLLLLLGGLIMIGNWILQARRKRGSLVPLIGGAFVAVAFVVIPLDILNSLWWLPSIVDLGCVPLAVLTVAHLICRAISGSDE